MEFTEFIHSGWDRHGTGSAAVADTLGQGLDLIGSPGDVAPFCGLATISPVNLKSKPTQYTDAEGRVAGRGPVSGQPPLND